MLIRRATRLDGAVLDIRVGEQIGQVDANLQPRPGEDVFDAEGGTVIPGLHDHHVHLHSAAAAETSLQVGPPHVRDRDALAGALATAQTGDDGWIRAIGYHDSVAGPLDRTALDALAPAVPVRIQHRSGVLWILNSAGLARVGLADHPDGRLRSADSDWSEALERRDLGLADVSRRLSSYGVTGITDATPDLEVGDIVRLTELHRHGELRQRLHFLSPGKRILRDDDLDLDELARWIAERHRDGGPVAIHCVTAAQLLVTIAALQQAGAHPRDRIEHAADTPSDCLDDLVDLGVTVVTQPNFVAERGDQYLAEIPAGEHHQLWRVASLLLAGVPVALSTDMPFGHGDPWAAMRAAVHRITPSGAVLGPDECVPERRALMMFLGWAEHPSRVRTVEPGQPGDLCVLSAPPEAVLAELDAEQVAATIIGGEIVYAAR
ncbi:amidohydrolase family protein [Mycobacterium branderi]|uniref:Amidohydrolase n=1 Tax=Mycobacterium branderi TaxID=43348 RepID=A0A7I7W0I7_9MYCO|nr:amidohydrolase family protein [Mycobacterium branderi]MCV7235528.1 amidohydrolase family protein [Mycobacterium branderi]ORA34301.1 amidohydrolase [Mycobacterium branderi]BBZ11114.1 amidohydrolase [Mycobacterium branderi]